MLFPQVLAGIYPIAQIQEPYTSVGYLASRIPVQALLHLRHPEAEDPSAEHPWCAWDICEGGLHGLSLSSLASLVLPTQDSDLKEGVVCLPLSFFTLSQSRSLAWTVWNTGKTVCGAGGTGAWFLGVPYCYCFLCLAWAEKRGYKTAKAARNDVYRAANSLLRLAVDGRLSLCFHPPGYSEQRGESPRVLHSPY